MTNKTLRRIIGLALVPLVLGSSACVARYTFHEMEDPWFEDKIDGGWVPHEIGLMTPTIPIGPAGLALSLEGSRNNLLTRAVPPLQDWDDVSLQSTTIGGRFFPYDAGPFRPYAGGGYGRTTVSARWTGPNYDPAPGIQCIGDCTDQFTEQLYRGYNPFLVGGVELGRGDSAFMVEYRKDLDRGDGFYRLSGSRISIGMRWRSFQNR
ncbi:MAG: hypothetical protein AAF389_09040 [Gemmatimonadota bacterium]